MRHSGGRIHHAVVAALDTGMVLIARDQQEKTSEVGIEWVAGRDTHSGNFTSIVNICRKYQLQTWIRLEYGV